MILNVQHTTTYEYLEPVRRSIQIIRLTPFSNNHQKITNWSLEIPGTTMVNVDWFGNITHCANIPSMLTSIEIKAHGTIEVFKSQPKLELGTLPALYYLRSTPLTKPSSNIENLALSAYQGTIILPNQSPEEILQILLKLSALILAQVKYVSGVTNSTTTASDAVNLRAGVCQDHAHIFLSCARFLEIPARYVSGYLHTDDTSHLASHAWVEAWVNNAWYSFDISNQCSAGEKYIELAYGLDYLDASPIRGSRVGGGEEHMTVLSLVTSQ